MQQDIINSPQPLRVEINASADTINLDNALTLHAVPNRKQGEMGEYLFDWTIRQDGQVVFQ